MLPDELTELLDCELLIDELEELVIDKLEELFIEELDTLVVATLDELLDTLDELLLLDATLLTDDLITP